MSENIILNVGGGSNGAALNFKVVGNPQPSLPSENTIWVNTDTPITGYEFSATEPVEPIEGLVWISTGTSSPVEFNALKKNGIQVYPLSAKQYVSGAWVDKTAKSYQNGEWVDWWNGELFENGNQFESVTGGWVKKSLTCGSRPNNGTVTIGTNIVTDSGGSDGYISAIATTKNAIDLTNVSSITMVVESVSGSQNLSVHSNDTGIDIYNNASAKISFNNAGTYSLDVSSLNGMFYISVGGNGNSKATTSYIKLD